MQFTLFFVLRSSLTEPHLRVGGTSAFGEIESPRDSEGLLAPMIDNYSGLLRQPSQCACRARAGDDLGAH